MLCRYLQLCHSLRAQFPDVSPIMLSDPLFEVIQWPDSAKSIFSLYNILLTPSATNLAYQINSWWETDVCGLDDTEWEEILDNYKFYSPSALGYLTQLCILHRAYWTLVWVSRYWHFLPFFCLGMSKYPDVLAPGGPIPAWLNGFSSDPTP